MSIRSVIISLIVAITLGGTAWYLLSRPEQPAPRGAVQPGALLVGIDPAAVRSILITAPDGSAQAVERGAEPGTWLAVLNVGTPAEHRWMIQTSAAQGLLRRLAETRAIAAPTPEELASGIGAGPTIVRIELQPAGSRTLRLAARTLGQRGLVEVEPASPAVGPATSAHPSGSLLAVIDDSLHKVFREPGPRGWREPRVFSGLGPDVSRIKLSNVDRTVSLGKVSGLAGAGAASPGVGGGGRWALIDPVAAPAEPESVRKLITLLADLSIEAFFDDQTPPLDTTGLDHPVATITIELDPTDPQAAAALPSAIPVRTETRELLLGKPSDGTQQRRYAAYSRSGPVFTIGSTTITQDTFTPSRYIQPRVLDIPVGDVGGVVLHPAALPPSSTDAPTPSVQAPSLPAREFKRSLDKWVELAQGKETPLADDEARPVNELLSFLAGEGPRSIELSPPPGWTERGSISLHSLGGNPLMVFTIGSTADGAIGAMSTDARSRPVFRVYSPGRAPALLGAIAAAARREADQRPAGQPAPDNEILK